MSDNKNHAFYFVTSVDDDDHRRHPTLDKAVEHAGKQAAKYGEDYHVFQGVKVVKATPRHYTSTHDLSFGHAPAPATA